MSKDELLKLRTEALENLLGYFGTPVARHAMGKRWTSDHDLIIKIAKEAVVATEEPALERFMRLEKAFGVRDDGPTVIGPAHMLRSLKENGAKKGAPPLDIHTWNLATENAARIAEGIPEGDLPLPHSRAIREVSRQIRLEKIRPRPGK